MPLLPVEGGGGRRKGTMWPFLPCFISGLPLDKCDGDGDGDVDGNGAGESDGDGDYVVVIWSEYCEAGVKLSENLKKLAAADLHWHRRTIP